MNERRRRTNQIIIAVTCIFFISWLPFNLFNIIAALHPKTFINLESKTNLHGHDDRSVSETGQLVYGFLHLLGAANACSNPILYGLLNENFLLQYKRLYRWLPGYYGNRARRYSIPSCQRYALNCNLERQNAFRIHRLSVFPSSHNGCQSLETTEENLMEPKVDSESIDGIEMAENINRIDYQISNQIEKRENDEINVSNDLQNEESFKTNKITFNSALIENIALKNTKIGPKASSKNIVYPIYQTEENTKENVRKVVADEKNLKMAIEWSRLFGKQE